MTRHGRPLMTMVSPTGASNPNSSRATVCPSMQTWPAPVTWVWPKTSPSVSGQLRTLKYSGVTPWMAVPQFAPR